MNTIGTGGLNPLSSQFTAKALQVATTQAATVKTKKDTEPQKKESSKDLMEDSVVFSDQGKATTMTKTLAAHHSGVMSELSKRERKNEDAGKLSMFGGEPEVYERKQEGRVGTPLKDKEEVDLEKKLDALEVMSKNPKEILADVPEGFASAAKKIVEGQIQKGKPAESLVALKEVPDTAPIELQPLKFVEIMPIHDSNNKPIPMEMGASVN